MQRTNTEWWDLTRLVGLVAAGALVIYALMALIVLQVPDGNDYALASNLKQDRLATLPGQRIVLVGGSNLAYGTDSRQLEALTGCPAVNMGMNGYFGIQYMLAEAAAGARAGDLIVLAFEWDNYFKAIEGASTDLAALAKANPRSFNHMTWDQRGRVLTEGIAYIARQKVLRLLRDGTRDLAGLLGVSVSESTPSPMENIETLAGFSPEGDLVSHLDVTWQDEIEQGTVTDQLETDIVPALEDFIADMEARGVSVMISYTPVMRSYYDQHVPALGSAHQVLSQSFPTLVPSPPSAYVFDAPEFFDTVYHLNANGRSLRTQTLAQHIARFAPWQCATQSTAGL